eukprot:153206_1
MGQYLSIHGRAASLSEIDDPELGQDVATDLRLHKNNIPNRSIIIYFSVMICILLALVALMISYFESLTNHVDICSDGIFQIKSFLISQVVIMIITSLLCVIFCFTIAMNRIKVFVDISTIIGCCFSANVSAICVLLWIMLFYNGHMCVSQTMNVSIFILSGVGCVLSLSGPEPINWILLKCKPKSNVAIDRNISKILTIEHKKDLKTRTILLLGISNSGKDDIFRQLKAIHGTGFEASEFIESKNVIRSNCVLGILKLLKKSQELYNENKEQHSDCYIELNQSIINDIHFILKFQAETFEEDDKVLSTDLLQLGESINRLWKLKQIQIVYSKRQYYSIIENMDFFLSKSSVIFDHKYDPNQEDHLKCRIRMTGLREATYMINDVRFRLYDVGGQINERKKWIHLFEGVTAIIFVAGLNHYASVLFEDKFENAMYESLQLFD